MSSSLGEVQPDDPCKCGHVFKFHAGAQYGSECRIHEGTFWRGETMPRGIRTKKCPCSRFEMKP